MPIVELIPVGQFKNISLRFHVFYHSSYMTSRNVSYQVESLQYRLPVAYEVENNMSLSSKKKLKSSDKSIFNF